MKARVARLLRRWADRMDWYGAPKSIHWTFTIEKDVGVRFREDARGCRLAYLGNAEYEKAHTEADNPT